MSNDCPCTIIDPQIRSAIIMSLVQARGGRVVSIQESQKWLFDKTGINEKEHNIRNTMIKLTKINGFSYADRVGLRYESHSQRLHREASEREAERHAAFIALETARKEADKALEKVAALETKLKEMRSAHLARAYNA